MTMAIPVSPSHIKECKHKFEITKNDLNVIENSYNDN